LQTGNELILALEDIVFRYASASKDWRANDTSKMAGLEKECTSDYMLIRIRDLFNMFQNDAKGIFKEIILKDSTSINMELLYFINKYYIEDLVDEIRKNTDKEKVIEEVYDVCHKVRKILIQLKKAS
jgi:hypothetical protein